MATEARARSTTLSAWLCEVADFVGKEPEAPPLAVGDRVLGRYEVRRMLGRGGMGYVYDVYDHERGCACALKTLRELGPERIVMLKNEFRAIARVRHPSLVRPGELLEDRGRWFFTMEIVEGHVPSAWIAGDELRLRHVIASVADVLAAMHEHGVVHRDIKPSNILIGEHDRVVVLDLGLACDRTRPLWLDHRAAGTAMYVAPEQITRSHTIGPAADMYSLGVLIYELATGRRPFAEANPTLRSVPSLHDLPPELGELCACLLADDPSARRSARAVAAQLGRRARASAPRALVGREPELARLHAAFDRVAAGHPTAVFVHGPSGIGKTALVDQFLDTVRERASVFAGRCYERETVPFKTLDGFVDAIVDTLARKPRRIPETCAPLGHVFPVLAAVEGFAATAPPSDLAGALHALLACFAGPLVLFVDDLQWADRDGLAVLARVLEGTALPILFVATSRKRERPAELARVAAHAIDVGPLSSADALRLATAVVGDPSSTAVARIVEQCGGHPLLIGEAGRLIAGQNLPDLDAVIAARCAELGTEERDVLELITIAGAPLPWSVLVAASDGSRERLEHRVHVLEAERLARWHGSGAALAIDTFHDRVREALHARMPAANQRGLHARLADAFASVRPEAHAQLAIHSAGAGRSDSTLHHARIAADHAIASLAHAHAAELLGLAIEHATDSEMRQGLRVERARALAQAFLPAQAARAYADAAACARGDARRLRVLSVEQALHAGELEAGLRELELASKIRAPRRAVSALASALARRIELRLPRLPLRGDLDAVDVDVLWSAASMLSMNDALLALGYHSRALRFARALGDPVRLGRSLALEACIQAGTGSFTESARLCAEAERLVDGDPLAAFNVRGAHLVLAVQLGKWKEALERVTPEHVSPNVWSNAANQLYLAHCEFNLGKLVELGHRGDRAMRQVHDRSDRYLELAMSVSFLPVIDLVRDEPARARETIARGRALAWRRGRGYFHALAAASSLFVELYAGDHRLALALWREGNTLLARKSHYGRVYLTYLGACAALGSRRLSIARKAARALARDPIPWAKPYGAFVEAQLAHLERGARDRALGAARAGFVAFGAEHMVDVLDQADARLAARGVANPAAFRRMLAPAFA